MKFFAECVEDSKRRYSPCEIAGTVQRGVMHLRRALGADEGGWIRVIPQVDASLVSASGDEARRHPPAGHVDAFFDLRSRSRFFLMTRL